MKNIYKANYLLKALLLIGFFGGVLTSCKKDAAVLLQDAAYVRFFNGITYYRYNSADNDDAAARYLPPNVTSINTVANFYNDGPISGNNPAPIQYRQPAPLVSFFVDPQLDDQGLPVSADVTADFIGTQKTYYTPQPDAVGDPVSTIQGDFPGVQGVERAPVVGGVDLSRWARIKSGKHRFLIIYRTLYNTDNLVYTNTGQLDPTARVTYYNLTQAQKAASIKGTYLKTTVAMDTTVNLDAHAVYTVKIVNKTNSIWFSSVRVWDQQQVLQLRQIITFWSGKKTSNSKIFRPGNYMCVSLTILTMHRYYPTSSMCITG